MSDQRFIDLETKVAYQELLIEELRQTTHAQYLELEKFEKNLKILMEKFKGNVDESLTLEHQKPPHY